MFKFFKNIGNTNKVWAILKNPIYLGALGERIGNTVVKIHEDSAAGNYLLVQSDNAEVKSILLKNESQIISSINSELGLNLFGIKIL